MAEDRSWVGLEYWQRVRWARLRAGYETAKDAAVSMGMQPNTYSAYEREPGTSKHTKLEHQAAIRFGRKFKVRWEWLLTGDGSPSEGEDPGPPHYQRIRKALEGATEAQAETAAALIEALLRTGTNDR